MLVLKTLQVAKYWEPVVHLCSTALPFVSSSVVDLVLSFLLVPVHLTLDSCHVTRGIFEVYSIFIWYAWAICYETNINLRQNRKDAVSCITYRYGNLVLERCWSIYTSFGIICFSAAEFVIYKLKEVGKIEEDDVLEVLREFATLDIDESGTLKATDIHVSNLQKQKPEVRWTNTTKPPAHLQKVHTSITIFTGYSSTSIFGLFMQRLQPWDFQMLFGNALFARSNQGVVEHTNITHPTRGVHTTLCFRITCVHDPLSKTLVYKGFCI